MDQESEAKEFRRQCVEYLDSILDEIRNFGDDVYILDDEHLAVLGIRRAEPLDVEERSVDFGPRFFYPRLTVEQAQQQTHDFLGDNEHYLGDTAWPERCRRGSFVGFETTPGPYDPEERHPLCSPRRDAECRLKWFLTVMGVGFDVSWTDSPHVGVWDGSGWCHLHERHLIPGRLCNLPCHWPADAHVGNPPRAYDFYVNSAFLTEDAFADFPHIGATVVDSAEAGEGEVLRSEVAAAVGLLKHQFRRGDFYQHHTLPALIFSFQHDRFGRVTQFHLDARSHKVVMRQSRLLNFRSDEPTTDAYHMMRWMVNRPMGETRLGKAVAEDVDASRGRHDVDENGGLLPIAMRAT